MPENNESLTESTPFIRITYKCSANMSPPLNTVNGFALRKSVTSSHGTFPLPTSQCYFRRFPVKMDSGYSSQTEEEANEGVRLQRLQRMVSLTTATGLRLSRAINIGNFRSSFQVALMQIRLNSMQSFRDRLQHTSHLMNSQQLNLITVQTTTRILELLKGIITKYNVCMQEDDFDELLRMFNEARNSNFI